MIKSLLVLALLAGSASAVQAQTSHLGIKAGGSLTSFVGKDVSSSSSAKLGVHGGLIANLDLSGRFSIQPELLYSMKGTKDQRNSGSNTLNGYQTLHYVDVPILLKVKADQLFFEAGPQLGVLVGATQTIESGTASNSISDKDNFNDLDFGYALGLGFQAPTGFLLGLRYNGGLKNIVKPVQGFGGNTIQPEARNSAFQLYVGYMFSGK